MPVTAATSEATMTISEHPNATAYRRTVEAFRARDLDTLRSLIAEDVVWHVPGHSTWQFGEAAVIAERTGRGRARSGRALALA